MKNFGKEDRLWQVLWQPRCLGRCKCGDELQKYLVIKHGEVQKVKRKLNLCVTTWEPCIIMCPSKSNSVRFSQALLAEIFKVSKDI